MYIANGIRNTSDTTTAADKIIPKNIVAKIIMSILNPIFLNIKYLIP